MKAIKTNYVSEWRSDNSHFDHMVVFEHNLGVIPT